MYDYLVVGSGIFGSTFAYAAHKCGKSCLVIDKRSHLGGNIYCEEMAGINVHKYGAHIIHTSDPDVWNFITSLVEVNRYTNSPIARYGDEVYNLPFNMNTFRQMWGVTTPAEARRVIDSQKAEALERMKKDGAVEPRNLEEQALLLVGKDIYRKLVKEYTEKQWGRPCTELPAFIIRRLPVRFVYDNNYFNDRWQGIPIGGYNRLTDALLKGVETRVNADFFADRPHWESQARRILFTGNIDEFFGCRLGQLQWRTVRFEHEIFDEPNRQGNAVVNYTSHQVPYTRSIEHKHFEMFGDDVYKCPQTVVSREYSAEWHPGIDPVYPVNDERNQSLYAQYRQLAGQQTNVIFGGRLAEYKYYDMGPAIRSALALAQKEGMAI